MVGIIMFVSDLKEKEILEIYTDANKQDVGDQIFIFLTGGIGILIHTWWGYYFDITGLKSSQLKSFQKLSLDNDLLKKLKLENIISIEGVSVYVLLSNKKIVSLIQELEDLERMAYHNLIEVHKPNSDRYDELLQDLKIAEDLHLKKTSFTALEKRYNM